MGRVLLGDPDLPRQGLEGRLDEVRECIACNTYLDQVFAGKPMRCLFNPELGSEGHFRIEPASRSKRKYGDFTAYFERQFKRLNLPVVLGVEVTPEVEQAHHPDVVIVSTGVRPRPFGIPGADGSNVVRADDVLAGRRR